ncbi:COP9 signalosome complex subunit 9, partial [Galemys pyrenaicus]
TCRGARRKWACRPEVARGGRAQREMKPAVDEMFPEGAGPYVDLDEAGGSTGLLMDLAANEKAVHADFFNGESCFLCSLCSLLGHWPGVSRAQPGPRFPKEPAGGGEGRGAGTGIP